MVSVDVKQHFNNKTSLPPPRPPLPLLFYNKPTVSVDVKHHTYFSCLIGGGGAVDDRSVVAGIKIIEVRFREEMVSIYMNSYS